MIFTIVIVIIIIIIIIIIVIILSCQRPSTEHAFITTLGFLLLWLIAANMFCINYLVLCRKKSLSY